MEYLQYNGNGSEQAFSTGNKRKRNYSYIEAAVDGCNPVRQRSQANARERDRTHRCKTSLSSVNSAFSTLRTLIPTEPKDRKLSKIETLRLASSYISHLGTQLMAGPIDQPCLRLTKQFENETGGDAPPSNSSATNRYQVCTFCIAHKKTPKNQNIEEYICPNSLEGAGYFDQSLLENAAISLNPGPDIYF